MSMMLLLLLLMMMIMMMMMSLDQHINNVCKACYYHIRSLHRLRQSLLNDVARTVACSIVTFRIGCCNSLYAGMSAANCKKLQRVQNTPGRVVHSSVVMITSHLNLFISFIGYLFVTVLLSK